MPNVNKELITQNSILSRKNHAKNDCEIKMFSNKQNLRKLASSRNSSGRRKKFLERNKELQERMKSSRRVNKGKSK